MHIFFIILISYSSDAALNWVQHLLLPEIKKQNSAVELGLTGGRKHKYLKMKRKHSYELFQLEKNSQEDFPTREKSTTRLKPFPAWGLISRASRQALYQYLKADKQMAAADNTLLSLFSCTHKSVILYLRSPLVTHFPLPSSSSRCLDLREIRASGSPAVISGAPTLRRRYEERGVG